jgi:hypothetical protein
VPGSDAFTAIVPPLPSGSKSQAVHSPLSWYTPGLTSLPVRTESARSSAVSPSSSGSASLSGASLQFPEQPFPPAAPFGRDRVSEQGGEYAGRADNVVSGYPCGRVAGLYLGPVHSQPQAAAVLLAPLLDAAALACPGVKHHRAFSDHPGHKLAAARAGVVGQVRPHDRAGEERARDYVAARENRSVRSGREGNTEPVNHSGARMVIPGQLKSLQLAVSITTPVKRVAVPSTSTPDARRQRLLYPRALAGARGHGRRL